MKNILIALLMIGFGIIAVHSSPKIGMMQITDDAPPDPLQPISPKTGSTLTLSVIKALTKQQNSKFQATETLIISGRVFSVKNRTQPLENVSILSFFMKDPVQYNPSLIEIPNTLGFTITLPDGSFILQFSYNSIQVHIQKYPYLAYFAFPGSNVSILSLKDYFASNPGNMINLEEILAYPFSDSGVLGVSGISHVNTTIPKDNFLRRPNLPLSEDNYCSPFTYQVLDNETGRLLLDVPVVFIQAFSSIIPIEDFFFWLPKNMLIDVRFIFYASDVGWVDEIWTFNTTYENAFPFSYHLLTLDVAKKALKSAEARFQELNRDGINLDHYWPYLEDAQISQKRSLDFWSQATPNITYSGSLQFFDLSDMGYKALFEAEIAILQAQRAARLANLYFESLSAQPSGIYALTTLLLATIISILISQAVTDKKRLALALRALVFSVMLASAYIANPLLKDYLESEKIPFMGISLPVLTIMIAFFLAIAVGSLFIPTYRLLDKPRTFLTLSVRNLRRRKSRTLIMLSTLGIAITSFVLIVSNNYEVSVITEGKTSDYLFDDGILIENYISIPLQGSFQLPMTKRVEVVVNVTLQVYDETDAAYAFRYYSTLFEEEPEITIQSFSSEDRWIHPLRNFLAITPNQEEKITKLRARFQASGNWLTENTSEVLVSESLKQKLNIQVNDTVMLAYNASGTFLSLPLTVSGIYSNELGELRNVNGKSLAPPNYNESRPCNSTEFVIMDFDHWRVQLARAVTATTGISVSKAPPTQIMLGTTNINVAKELADRLEQQRIIMGKNGIVYTVKVSFFEKTEGVIPQIVPLGISCLVVYQIILNSIWERRREIRVYGTLGLSDRGAKTLLSAEYIILGAICGAIAYYVGLILFPIVKAANIESSFLSQKTDVSFAFISVILAIAICGLAAIPAITRVYGEIVPYIEKRSEDRSADPYELPALFNQTDLPWLEGQLKTVPYFQDASFDSLGVALGQKKATITLNIANGVIRAFLHPGELSKNQVKRIAKKWLAFGLGKRP